MGHTAVLIGSKLDLLEDRIVEISYHASFQDVGAVFVSDHFNRNEISSQPGIDRVTLFDDTFLAFVNRENVEIREYEQQGTIFGSSDDFEYVSEIFFGENDLFSVFFLILPKDYYPDRFVVPEEPHFAAIVDDRIHITWWSKDQIKIKLRIRRNSKKVREFEFIDSPTFLEKHPDASRACEEAKGFGARLFAEILKPS